MEHEDFKAVIYNVFEKLKSLGLIAPKLDFMWSTELARRSMAGTDQLLQDLSARKTEKNLLHALMPELSRRNGRY